MVGKILCACGFHWWKQVFSGPTSPVGIQFVVMRCRRCECEKTVAKVHVP